MKEGKNEFLGLLCNLYITALLTALPLYTGKGYWQLGDTKYMLFRNLSFLCLGCWLLAGLPGRVRNLAEQIRMRKRGQKGIGNAMFSVTDGAVALYGICTLISAACSSYGQLAWEGYEGWYMGAVSQLLFVGIYFFVSRQHDGAAWPVWLGEIALFLVTVLGLLHRLGIDPLGLMRGWNSGDWEYSHMLSTLGNINWLCGYYSVAMAFVMAHYLQAEALWLRAALYLASLAVFVLLCIQGSQGGLLILAVCVAVCFWMGRRREGVWKRLLLLMAGTFLVLPLMEALMKLRGDKAAFVADGNIFGITDWYGWAVAAVSCLFLYFLIDRSGDAFREGSTGECGQPRRKEWEGETGKKPVRIMAETWAGRPEQDGECVRQEGGRKCAGCRIVLVLGGISAGILLAALFWNRMNDGFGSGRGFLWRIAAEGFVQADAKDKLLGAGPDCYGEAVFNRLGAGTDVWKGEHWEGAVFTNAHNEILSQLCNIGILGTVSYLGIFLAGLRRYGGMGREGGLGLLALAMYGAHSMVSFQQVLNTPLLFLVLGLCEAGRRNRHEPQTLSDRNWAV